jgi:hypothetical protein
VRQVVGAIICLLAILYFSYRQTITECAKTASRITHLVFLQSSGDSIAVEREECAVTGGKFLHAMVTDGLSHGPFAERAAREAAAVFRSQATTERRPH